MGGMPEPILFLDIDGVLLTGRAWAMAVNAEARELARRDPEAAAHAATFDANAVRLLVGLVEETGAKLVVASRWRYSVGPEETLAKLVAQGVAASIFHADWCCPMNRIRQEKCHDILQWLRDHRLTPEPLCPAYPWPEGQTGDWKAEYEAAMASYRVEVDEFGFPFATVDDDGDLPRLVRTDFHEGLSRKACAAIRRELLAWSGGPAVAGTVPPRLPRVPRGSSMLG